MKKNLFGIGLGAILLLLSGCAHKEVLSSKYYPNYAKDDILLAGKYAFLIDKEDRYVVDSYRDRLEATKIGLVFHTLLHEDYVLKVEEDACGTLATLVLEGSYGVDKTSKYHFSEQEHLKFWDTIDLFIKRENHTFSFFDADTSEINENIFVSPTKDMNTCRIKNEFENGLMKDSIKNTFGVCDENK